LSALNAISRVGDASCVERLIAVAGEKDTDLVESAKAALSQLPDEKANSEIASRLSKASGPTLAMLIAVVGERGISATEELVSALKQDDPLVRSAALTALGDIVPADRLSVLISQCLNPKSPEDRPHAEKALKTAAIRMPDREACAGELVAAMDKATPASKVQLLDILAAVGGTKALQAMDQAAKSNSEPLRDASTRLLGSWMTIDAAPVLLDLSKRGPMDRYQVRAVRGYLRIARQFTMSEPERIAMAQQALEIAKDNEEKKLVLDVVKRYPNVELLRLAVKIGAAPALREDAKDAAKVVKDKLKEKSPEVIELLSQLGL
jgi:hypothetical protein